MIDIKKKVSTMTDEYLRFSYHPQSTTLIFCWVFDDLRSFTPSTFTGWWWNFWVPWEATFINMLRSKLPLGAPLKDAFQQPQLLQEASQEAKDALRCQMRVRFVGGLGGWLVGGCIFCTWHILETNQEEKPIILQVQFLFEGSLVTFPWGIFDDRLRKSSQMN